MNSLITVDFRVGAYQVTLSYDRRRHRFMRPRWYPPRLRPTPLTPEQEQIWRDADQELHSKIAEG